MLLAPALSPAPVLRADQVVGRVAGGRCAGPKGIADADASPVGFAWCVPGKAIAEFE